MAMFPERLAGGLTHRSLPTHLVGARIGVVPRPPCSVRAAHTRRAWDVPNKGPMTARNQLAISSAAHHLRVLSCVTIITSTSRPELRMSVHEFLGPFHRPQWLRLAPVRGVITANEVHEPRRLGPTSVRAHNAEVGSSARLCSALHASLRKGWIAWDALGDGPPRPGDGRQPEEV